MRGWPFVLSWLHRLTGLGLILFVWFHLYTLQDLLSPSIYDLRMRFYQLPLLRFSEWLLALPVFFHALDGGRLILYESFRFRNDEGLIRWSIGLLIVLSGLLAILMILGNQEVSALFFWTMTLATALVLTFGGGMRIWRTENTLTWKCQRLSSIFMLVMIPAHFFFMVKSGEWIIVQAKATVLATSGCGQVFRVTTNCRQNTGDAQVVVLRAGLPLMDMEAMQFHPTGIVGPGILASETLRSVGGILRNREMDPFMVHYAPKMKELAPRDLVARAIETEIREGRGILNPDHQIEHVWIDLRHLSEYIHQVQIPEVTGFFKRFMNLDPPRS